MEDGGLGTMMGPFMESDNSGPMKVRVMKRSGKRYSLGGRSK